MGELRQRRFKFCTTCGRAADRACRLAEHPTELRTWPTWWIRYYRNGRRHEESAHTEKYSEAERLLKQREGDVANGVPMTAKVGQLRFEDAAADLLSDYKINGKRSHDNLKAGVIEGALEPWFRNRRMASITTTDIRAYVDHRQEKGFANATINRELAALKRMYTLALQGGKLLQRPYIPMLAEHNARQGFFERGQFESVRARLSPALQAVITAAYYTGWRINSELLTLQWRQVDREAGVLRLEPNTTKNRDGRTFKYTAIEELHDTIEALWATHEALERQDVICPWVFNRRGRQIKLFRRAWLTACTAAGCPGRIPHDFRRTAVRNLTRAGVPETVAMKVTGHKTRSVFDRYDITSEEDLAEASRKLQALAGTFTGTLGKMDAEALKARLLKTLEGNRLVVARDRIELSTLRFSVRSSKKQKA